MIDSGAPSPRGSSAPRGSGVTSAIATAAPARWPAHGPTSARARRWSRSRQTMNVQRCRFLLLPARRPARRMRSRWSASSGRSAKRADDPHRGDRLPDGVVGRVAVAVLGVAHGSIVGAAGIVPGVAVLAPASGSTRGGRVAPGSATLASVRRPPGVPLTASNGALDIRDPLGVGGLGAFGRRRPDRAARRRPASGNRPRRRGRPGPRTATSAGHPRRPASRPRLPPGRPARAARAAVARRSMWLGGTTVSSSPWASRTGPVVAGDRRSPR